MKPLQFRYHPIIEGLRINEDGTEIYLKYVRLRVFVNDRNRANPTLKVNFNNRAHSVAKLVCEAWIGMSEYSTQRASKINELADNHYSNLEWKEGASNGIGIFKQKLSASDIDEIIEFLKSNKKLKEIASIYGVDISTISRIKKRYVKEDK